MSGERRFGASPLDVGHLDGFAQARASCGWGWKVGGELGARESRPTAVGVNAVRGQSCGASTAVKWIGLRLWVGFAAR